MKGFTLVELVIVIAIVIVLSVVSVPIYRNYVDKAKYAEGYALLGTILTAQKTYYSENGFFYGSSSSAWISQSSILGVDARGNKFFTSFANFGFGTTSFWVLLSKPEDLRGNGTSRLSLTYNITSGATFKEENAH